MGLARFQANNLITSASMLTVSSATNGIVGSAVPSTTGSAALIPQGPYTGDDDIFYTVEIDSVAGGAEVGQATFRWRRDDSAGWEASGVTTSASFTTLSDGVQVKWTTAAGNDFALGDSWRLLARRLHGRAAMIDNKPNSQWCTTGVYAESAVIDLGAAQQVTACIVGLHNLSAGASITLEANTADSWGAPAYSQAIEWALGTSALYLDETYRYWRLVLSDSANPAGVLSVGELYLGTHLEPTRDLAYSDGLALAPYAYGSELTMGSTPAGRYVASVGERFSLGYIVPLADRDTLKGLWRACHDQSARAAIPLWFTPDSDYPSETYFGIFGNDLSTTPVHDKRGWWRVDVSFAELPRT